MLDFIPSILKSVRSNLLRSYMAGGDATDKGNDWRVLIHHINGDDAEFWEMFREYIISLLESEAEKLTNHQRRLLTAAAYDDQHNYSAEEYLAKASAEEKAENLPYYTPDIANDYLFDLLWVRADSDSEMIEDDEDDGDEIDNLWEELEELIEEAKEYGEDEVKKFAVTISEVLQRLRGSLEQNGEEFCEEE